MCVIRDVLLLAANWIDPNKFYKTLHISSAIDFSQSVLRRPSCSVYLKVECLISTLCVATSKVASIVNLLELCSVLRSSNSKSRRRLGGVSFACQAYNFKT
jgi:hypothetical protein